jgi:P-type Cu2+ transporter
MSCCGAGAEAFLMMTDPAIARQEVLLASHRISEDLLQTDLSVPGIHCGGCIQAIERSLGALPDIEHARVNLSTKRVTIRWRGGDPPPFIETLDRIGYKAHLFDVDGDRKDPVQGELVRALAVAGFAASNIMLLSVSVWSGAEPATRDMFHWLSALIALPALIYSGRVFFRSAWQSLRHGRTNMDVPISIGILLATGMSLYETFQRGEHAYFDAAVSLVFFLLIGRTLDHVMRERARSAVKGLSRLAARGALVVQPDGTRVYMPVNEIAPGMTILLAAGERVPVDGRVTSGRSELDVSLVSGESLPQPVVEGTQLQAGTMNLTGPLTIVATAAARNSFLAEMTRMMEAAEGDRSNYRRIADRAASLYAPVVHLTALLTFIGWMVANGDLHQAVTVAIAVLIITCPCALGLAVPMVQVVAAARLFENGIMVKDGGALERLAEIDTVVFDKTGTLTLGNPQMVNTAEIAPEVLALASAIASHSRHPYSRALAAKGSSRAHAAFTDVQELPGSGLEAREGSTIYRLGRREWALSVDQALPVSVRSEVVLSRDGVYLTGFHFDDSLRRDACEAIATLKDEGLSVEVLSGDREQPVSELAGALGLDYTANVSPREKVARISTLNAKGRKVLMAGDGLNDAPALASAYASIAPATAADIGRNVADLVFLRESLFAVPLAMEVARDARHLVRQNLALAVGYNAVAVPLAVFGHVTPLIAAVAMSISSIAVIANALRVGRRPARPHQDTAIHTDQRIASQIAFGSHR